MNNNGYFVAIQYKSLNGIDFSPVEQQSGYTYFLMPDLAEYCICMRNSRPTNCDVIVSIDGNKVGRWRINAGQSITVERPVGVNRVFKFVKETSQLATAGGVQSGDQENGLIKFEFLPERQKTLSINTATSSMSWLEKNSFDDSFSINQELGQNNFSRQLLSVSSLQMTNESNKKKSTQDYRSLLTSTPLDRAESGATILGRTSDQHFTEIPDIEDVDEQHKRTLIARMVVDARQPVQKPHVHRFYKPKYIDPELPPRIELLTKKTNVANKF